MRAFALVACLAFASSLEAGPLENRSDCEGRTPGVTTGQRELACSAILGEQSLTSAQSAMTLVHRAWARAQLGRRADALADYDRALALAPDSHIVLNERALLHLREGRLDAALRDYDAALKAKPGEAFPLYGRGVARLRKGDRANGEADLRAARIVMPNVDETFRRIGVDASKR